MGRIDSGKMEMKAKMRIKKINIICLALAGTLLMTLNAHAADQVEDNNGDLWVAGSKEQIYLLEQTVDEGNPILQIGSREGSQKEMTWQQAIGRLRGAVTIESELYLSFDDGTLMRFNGGYDFPPIPNDGQTEQLVVDAKQDQLYVLAGHDAFSNPENNQRATQPATAPSVASTSGGTRDSTWVVYKLTDGQWKYCCSLPNDLGINAQPMMIVENDFMDLFVRPDPFSDKLYHWSYDKNAWVSQPMIRLPQGASRIWAMSVRGVQAVIISRSVDNGEVLDLYHLIDDKLEKITTLSVEENVPLVFTGKYAISESPEQSMIVACNTGKKTIAITQWSAYGQLLGDSDLVPSMSVSETKYEPSTWVMMALSAGLLILVLMRKGADPQEITLPATMICSPFWRRGAAFVIDFMPAVILSTFIWWDYFKPAQYTSDFVTYFQQMQYDPKMLMINLFTSAVYVAYSILMDGVWGTTPGKRIFGLQIRQLRDVNSKPDWKSAALRNVIKMIELYYAPLLLVLFFTKYRQRLGDIIAGTIVVIADNEISERQK
jgi:uncharacterized RDD family membrane protein YckC